MYIFLSPHFDDAVGSAGGVIKRLVEAGNECCIMTITTAIPWLHLKHINYVLHRHSENKKAAQVLGCSIKNAPFLDARYRKEARRNKRHAKKHNTPVEITEYELIDKIRNYIVENTESNDILIAPAGLGGHIDHRIVNLAVQNIDRTVYFYEEFYYDIKEKESPLTADYTYVYLTQEELAVKLNAILLYNKTLQKLFRKEDWRRRTTDYFTAERLHYGEAYERFSDISFMNGI